MSGRRACVNRRSILAVVAMGAALPRLDFGPASTNNPSDLEGTTIRLRLAFADHDFTATLNDTPSIGALWSVLPLDLTIEDYASNENIAYLPVS